jgi:PilZ domain
MRMETTRTVDVSRDGFRISRAECCDIGSRVWITFPFDASSSAAAQPETPAHVVRVDQKSRGGYDIALQLQLPPKRTERPGDAERRSCDRVTFAVPIFVRATSSPWPEESMTHDISRAGARFETAHIFSAGDAILVKVPWGEWEHSGEIPAHVVRVEAKSAVPGPAPRSNPMIGLSGMLTSISVRWDSLPKR